MSLPTLDLAAAARLLRVHPQTLQRLARERRVPAHKVGRAWIFSERLLVDWLEAQSLARVSVVDLQENTECRSTDARTRPSGGSNFRRSAVSRELYSRALGLPIEGRRSRSTTDSPPTDGSRTGSA